MKHARITSILLLVGAMTLLTACVSQAPRIDLFGNTAPASAAQRTIVITPDMRWVNIEGGEIITFVVSDKSFTWDFFIGGTVTSFDLNLIAPPGILEQRVTAYLTVDPRYRGVE